MLRVPGPGYEPKAIDVSAELSAAATNTVATTISGGGQAAALNSALTSIAFGS